MGLRGPGESQLESDKRIIRKKIAALKKELLQLHRHRSLHRVRREKMVRLACVLGCVVDGMGWRTYASIHTGLRQTPTRKTNPGLPGGGAGGVHQLGQVHAA